MCRAVHSTHSTKLPPYSFPYSTAVLYCTVTLQYFTVVMRQLDYAAPTANSPARGTISIPHGYHSSPVQCPYGDRNRSSLLAVLKADARDRLYRSLSPSFILSPVHPFLSALFLERKYIMHYYMDLLLTLHGM